MAAKTAEFESKWPENQPFNVPTFLDSLLVRDRLPPFFGELATRTISPFGV